MMDKEIGLQPAGSVVAVVTMLGSLSPVTIGHILMFTEARKLLLGRQLPELETFATCVGLISLNSDDYVSHKLAARGDRALSQEQRLALIDMATADMPWISSCTDDETAMRSLARRYPTLVFERFVMNGADDVVKYKKWKNASPRHRLITMGRLGSMEELREGMQRSGFETSANFVLGPVIAQHGQSDISSSGARAALKDGNYEALLKFLHPAVASWLLRWIQGKSVLDLPHLNSNHWARVCESLDRMPLICGGMILAGDNEKNCQGQASGGGGEAGGMECMLLIGRKLGDLSPDQHR